MLAEGSAELTPDWSPDGAWSTFNSERNGMPDLYRVRVDGSRLVFFSRRANKGSTSDADNSTIMSTFRVERGSPLIELATDPPTT